MDPGTAPDAGRGAGPAAPDRRWGAIPAARCRIGSPARRVAALALLALLTSARAPAACLPLGDAAIDELEKQVGRDPVAGYVRLGREIADAARGGDALREAQLWSVSGSRSMADGQAARVREAIARGRAALARLPAESGVAATRVARRLVLDESRLAATPAGHRAALATLHELLEGLDPDSIDRACALVVRSYQHSAIGSQQEATLDALTAYRLAERGGWAFAKADAAIALATAHRRAGLHAVAARYIEEAIAGARVAGPPTMLARALYVRAQVRLNARQFDAARQSLDAALAIWRSRSDRFSEMAGRHLACTIAIDSGDRLASDRDCAVDEALLLQQGRPDMVVAHRLHLARAALDRGALADAARWVEAAAAVIPPGETSWEGRLLTVRARLRAAQGRYADALADFERGAEIEREVRLAERLDAARLFDTSLQAERALDEVRVLRAQTRQDQAELARAAASRRFWIAALAGSGGIILLLLVLVAIIRQRTARERRDRAVLETLAANSPDAIVLLDADGVVRLANRGLFGDAAPQRGASLSDLLPVAARSPVAAALARARDSLEPASTDVHLDAGTPSARIFELRATPVLDRGRLLGATLRAIDVTASRAIERAALEASTRERLRVAGRLHDGLGQELTGVAMLLETLASQAARGQTADAASLKAASGILSQSVGMARGLAEEVAPLVAARSSLRDALETLGRRARETLQIDVQVDYAVELVPDAAMADGLYEIVEHALASAATLRRASRAHVAVQGTGADGLRLTVDDDGRAASSESQQAREQALQVLAYRARVLGGELAIATSPLGGLRLALQAAVPRQSAGASTV